MGQVERFLEPLMVTSPPFHLLCISIRDIYIYVNIIYIYGYAGSTLGEANKTNIHVHLYKLLEATHIISMCMDAPPVYEKNKNTKKQRIGQQKCKPANTYQRKGTSDHFINPGSVCSATVGLEVTDHKGQISSKAPYL